MSKHKGVTPQFVDLIMNTNRRKVGIDTKKFVEEIRIRNEKFDKVSKTDKTEALRLRRETIEYLIEKDLEALAFGVKNLPSDKTSQINTRLALANKLTDLYQLEVKSHIDTEEIFNTLHLNDRLQDKIDSGRGVTCEYLISLIQETKNVENYAVTQMMYAIKGIEADMRAKFKAFESGKIDEVYDMYKSALSIAYITLTLDEEDKPVEVMLDIISDKLKDIPLVKTIKFGLESGLLGPSDIVSSIKFAQVTVNTFAKNNPVLDAVYTARDTVAKHIQDLDITKMEDVMFENTDYKSSIKTVEELDILLAQIKQVCITYSKALSTNIAVGKNINVHSPKEYQALQSTIICVEKGLQTVLNGIINYVNDDNATIGAKAVLAACIYNIFVCRLKSDRDVCRGSEIFMSEMEQEFMHDIWLELAIKIKDYVDGFEIDGYTYIDSTKTV